MKIRTIIVIDNDIDLYDMTGDELIRTTQEQLENGEIPVEDLMDMSSNTTIVVTSNEEVP